MSRMWMNLHQNHTWMTVASASVVSALASVLASVARLAVAVTAAVALPVRRVSALAPLPVLARAVTEVAPMLAASAYWQATSVVWKDDARKAMPLELLLRSWSH